MCACTVYMYMYMSLQAEMSIFRYGKVLLAELPEEATQLLQLLCTEWVPEGQQPSAGIHGMGPVVWNGACGMEQGL